MSTIANHTLLVRATRAMVVLGPALLLSSATAQECSWTYWNDPSALPPPQGYLGEIAYDEARARVILAAPGSGTSLSTWTWDLHGWTEFATVGPPWRSGHGLVYDSARGRTVLFGGYGSAYFGDTWEWDGAVWVRVSIPGPSARSNPAMTYDPVRHRTVLFGGYNAQPLGDTWEYDGVAWSPRATTGPAPRYSAAIALDVPRERTVLFGGKNSQMLGDTWEWDGLSWTQSPGAAPPVRSNADLFFDPTLGGCVLYGGYHDLDSYDYLSDTWIRIAGHWSLAADATPAGTYIHRAVYDTALARGVLFRVNGYGASDTWLWDATAPRVPPAIAEQPAPAFADPGGSAIFSVSISGCTNVSYRWRRDGQDLSNTSHIFGATLGTLLINPVSASDYGSYTVVISNATGSVTSQPALLAPIPPPSCYPNCDRSTITPTLNISDFLCFLNAFAASDPYANCDGSTTVPTLNVQDFLCFLNRFAAGCG